MKSTKKEPQAYHAPQVTDYGNVRQITMTVGQNCSFDNTDP
jgi:hypothetical protein